MTTLASRRILITGGGGFLGQHLISHLRATGALDITSPSRRDYNLLDPVFTASMLDRFQPDLIYHLAATVGGIGANRSRPADFIYENAMMGLNLLDAARRITPKAKIILVGTVCSYPKRCATPFKEDTLWAGYPEETNAPYGVAKKMLLVAAQSYRQQYGLNVVYLIPVNLYGPGDHFDLSTSHVVPALIRKFSEAKESSAPAVTVWGTGHATREFLYVKDAARALTLAGAAYEGSEPVNVGSGSEITIADLARKIATLVGYSGDIVYDPSYPDGQPHRCLDVLRAVSAFNFRATTSLDDGLRETLAWFKTAELTSVRS